MLYSISEIERDARIMLNENVSNRPCVDDDCQLSLSERIKACVVPALKQACMQAPAADLGRGHNFADAAVCWGHEGAGHVRLPRDFMRLVAFEMSDWATAVYEAISPADHPDAYALQRSKFRGLRGTPQQPVCAIVNLPEALALEFYSCSDRTAVIVRAEYVPLPKFDSDGCIDVPERLYHPMLDIIATRLK